MTGGLDKRLVCFDCGRIYGKQKHNNSTRTTHHSECAICHRFSTVAEAAEWGGLREMEVDDEKNRG